MATTLWPVSALNMLVYMIGSESSRHYTGEPDCVEQGDTV